MYLQRRFYSFYFRIAIPKSIQSFYGKSEICFSLNTLNRTEARLKSLEHIQKYLIDFEQKKALPKPVIPVKTEPMKNRSLSDPPVNELASFSFSSIFRKYQFERKPSQGTVMEFNTVVRRFIAICGDKDIRRYTKKDIVHFKDVLLKYPKNLTQEDVKLTVDELFKKYENKDYVRLSAKTIGTKYLALLGTIFRFAVNNDYRTDNPVATVKVISEKQLEPSRLPFSLQQVKKITSSYVITNPPDERHIEYKYVILLGIFTGARIEEICRLRNDDIGIENGINFIFIQPDLKRQHTLKTASSRRRVPLHPKIMNDFDFKGYLKTVSGKEYVFPYINQGTIIKGTISRPVSKWFGRFLNTIGLKDNRLTFHSFRHTFKAFGRVSGIEKSILDSIQGHKDNSVSLNYGRDEYGSAYTLETMFEAVMKIRAFSEL